VTPPLLQSETGDRGTHFTDLLAPYATWHSRQMRFGPAEAAAHATAADCLNP
jgi:hypothetical protein